MPVISDKDGGRITELRGEIGALPVYYPGTGDGSSRQYWFEQINISTSGDNTVHTTQSGKRFFINSIVFTVPQAGAAIRLKSGASDVISGFIRPPALTPVTASSQQEPFLRGAAIDQNFVINTSGDGMTPYVGGWVAGYDEGV